MRRTHTCGQKFWVFSGREHPRYFVSPIEPGTEPVTICPACAHPLTLDTLAASPMPSLLWLHWQGEVFSTSQYRQVEAAGGIGYDVRLPPVSVVSPILHAALGQQAFDTEAGAAHAARAHLLFVRSQIDAKLAKLPGEAGAPPARVFLQPALEVLGQQITTLLMERGLIDGPDDPRVQAALDGYAAELMREAREKVEVQP